YSKISNPSHSRTEIVGTTNKSHRRDAMPMIAQKGLPTLRWWLPSPRHVLRHGGLPDIDTELEQFAVDPSRSPKRVHDAHLANELTNVCWCLGPATARP